MNNKCPNCGANSSLYIQGTDLNQSIDSSIFSYYLCDDCNLTFMMPIPSDLSKYYETEYPPYSIPSTLADLQASVNLVSWRVDLLQEYTKSGKILEIGPSYGAFAYAATQAEFQVDTIEMDKDCCEYINNNIPNAEAIHTNNVLEGMSMLEGKYDAIVFWHNIEHLVNPWNILEEAVKRLNSKGTLIISTPNPDSLQFKIFKKYWVHLDAPRHLALVPHSVLSKFLINKGMQLQLTTTTDPDGLVLNNMGWRLSLSHALNLSKRNIFKSIIYKVLILLISKLIYPLERWGDFGAAYTVVFQKK